MEKSQEIMERCQKGKKLIIAIIIGRIILECLSIALAIFRESGWGAAVIACIIWIVLLIELYLGCTWVPVVIATLHSISTLIGIMLLLYLIPSLTHGYRNILLMIAILAVVIYLIISAIALFKNENIKAFLASQA